VEGAWHVGGTNVLETTGPRESHRPTSSLSRAVNQGDRAQGSCGNMGEVGRDLPKGPVPAPLPMVETRDLSQCLVLMPVPRASWNS
jgi:hypothetical protein